MTVAQNIDLPTVLAERLTTAHPDVLRELLATFIHTLMGAEADALCGAGYGERSTDRTNQRNGYRHRQFDTRAGSLDLAIPKLRHGSYFPDWLLERRKRAERALTTVVATCYLLGVSTRRMDKLVETLGITSLSKSQVSVMAKELDTAVEAFRTRPLDAGPYTFVAADALVLKVREGGRVVNVHALIAVGVNNEGYREILGIDVTTAEDGAGWLTFWRSLTARGLSGVKLVTSDAHAGLVAAIGATLPGATWQRCRTHYTTNLMALTPKASWPWVRTLLHSVFDQPDSESVAAQYDRIIDALSDKLPKVADHLEVARPDLLAFTAFPKQIWRQIWSNNPQERLNKEIRRRTDVVGIFPDRDALIRLVGAVLAEQHDEWAESRRYLGLDVLSKSRTVNDTPNEQEDTPAALTA
ncbi:IS256 family transposase [Mycolicibacterium sp. S3B2]|uniref:IS256 family transposase n=1 Tax=Mycolicibacterium sp. S3B2 TaxID=3415120 RepID=UPI003C7BACD3